MGVARSPQRGPDVPLILTPSRPLSTLRFATAESLSQVDASAWDRLFDSAYPFTSHAFLLALEEYGCVGDRTGWIPQHLLAYQDERLVGAAVLYVKLHSYGEFVFDFAWAEASHRLGQPYYPKLLNAVPFTPSMGPRIGAQDAATRDALIRRLAGLTDGGQFSSAHALFATGDDAAAYQGQQWLERNDVQFQWFNRGDADFASFAARFSSDKRKKMLRERRRVADAGLRFETRRGDEIDESEWSQVYALYANTYEERGQAPYLTPEFLMHYGRRAGSPFRVILGYHGTRLVAAALTLQGGDTLYGRHWGAAEQYHSLHFECCYYQGIELCLQQGLRRYDAGTQGEHKLARGFTPVLTQSFHWIADQRLRDAVEHFLARERRLVASRKDELMHHSPYRQEAVATA